MNFQRAFACAPLRLITGCETLRFQAEKEEQAAKEIAPAKEFTGPVETAPAPEPGWVNEVESTAVATENWADDVAPPAAPAIPAAGPAPAFQASGDWAAQVRRSDSFSIHSI